MTSRSAATVAADTSSGAAPTRPTPHARRLNPRLFTADELPAPSAEMRLPPAAEEETLFSTAEAE
jgi:hypothetical protein